MSVSHSAMLPRFVVFVVHKPAYTAHEVRASACHYLSRGITPVNATQVLGQTIEHAGAPLNLESKNKYMQRKIDDRGLAPNSIQNGGEQVCKLMSIQQLHAVLPSAMFLLLRACQLPQLSMCVSQHRVHT